MTDIIVQNQSELRRELTLARRAAEQSDTMVKAKINELHQLHEHLNETTALLHQHGLYTEQLGSAVAAHFVQAVHHIELLEHIVHEANVDVPPRPLFAPPEDIAPADSELAQHAAAVVHAALAAHVEMHDHEVEQSVDQSHTESDHEQSQVDDESITL